ncbi:hypothetical protein [Streptomyces sp. NPDC014623]|uniref:hypothetical protein n=1 Tax=Streptomyces sp. NPDC014623 TaxID=3364875 RepID=UPI0036F883C5
MTTITRPHGYARYTLDGCRCCTCGWANSEYRHARAVAIQRGTWQPFVSAVPVREHLLRLRECSLGTRRVAEIAQVDRKRLQAVINGRPERGTGPQEKVRPALAIAVLQVRPTLDNLGSVVPIDATGTHRRLQALGAAGWPRAQLAQRLGRPQLSDLFASARTQVRTARRTRDLYDVLWAADPRAHGVCVSAYNRARNNAVQLQWAPVGAWDDDTIDDPAVSPEWTGACGTPEGWIIHQRIGVPACPPCNAARSEYRRAKRAAEKSVPA